MVTHQTQSMQIMIDKTIKKLEQAFEELNEYFGENTEVGGLRYVIESPLYTDCPWIVSGSNSKIRFAYLDDTEVNDWNDLNYSNKIIGGLYEKEEYTAAYVDNGCGDQFWMVLKNSNRRKDIEKQDE